MLRLSSLFHVILSTLGWTVLKDSVLVFYNSLVICKGTFYEIWLRIYPISLDSVDFQEELFYNKAVQLDFFTWNGGSLNTIYRVPFYRSLETAPSNKELLEDQHGAKCSFCFSDQIYLHHWAFKSWDPNHLSLKVAENVINVVASLWSYVCQQLEMKVKTKMIPLNKHTVVT